MDALQLVESLHPTARIRELAAGANRVFRVTAPDNLSTSIVKVYPVASRERRERRALEALAGQSLKTGLRSRSGRGNRTEL